MNLLQILQLVFTLGPEALAMIEAILAAINSTPGTQAHTDALSRLQALAKTAAAVAAVK